MKLVILTKSTFFVEEDKILASLFDEGLQNLHLSKPGASPMFSERLLTLLPEEALPKITVHEHFYLKDEYNLAGIHIDQPGQELPFNYRGRISGNCSDLSLLRDAKKKYNYVFLKNIFNCIEFPDQRSNFNMRDLEEASRQGLIDKRVYALGGMTLDNVRMAKDLGFGGVVICGDLWNRFNIHQQLDYKELIAHFGKLRKIVE